MLLYNYPPYPYLLGIKGGCWHNIVAKKNQIYKHVTYQLNLSSGIFRIIRNTQAILRKPQGIIRKTQGILEKKTKN